MGSSSHKPDPKIFAVLIGIDGYSSSPLSGCVSDAKAMGTYLIDTLHVPKDNIRYLLRGHPEITTNVDRDIIHVNKEPTRADIIETLVGLSRLKKKGIEKIIIYFAGHGSIYLNSDYYTTRGIESCGFSGALCPVDRCVLTDTDTKIIPDIGDRLINDILSKIFEDTGAHITIILDCCHSSGITQGMPGAIPRNVNPKEQDKADSGDTEGQRHTSPLLSTLEAIFDSRDPKLDKFRPSQDRKSENWVPNTKSHVLLAACQGYQQAKEESEGTDGARGIFTKALITALKSNKSTTYDALIRQLNEELKKKNITQIPIAVGERNNTQLWSQKEPPSKAAQATDPSKGPDDGPGVQHNENGH